MQKRRPVSVLVIAILQLVIGGLGIVCGLCAGAGSVAGDNPFQAGAANNPEQVKLKELTKKLEEKTKEIQERKVPAKRAYEIGNQVLNWVLSIAMVLSGIGLLKMQSWARLLAILYAVVSFLHKVVVAIYTFAFLNPAHQEALEQIPAQDRQTLGPIMTFALIFAGIMVFVTMIYPLVVLIVMVLPSVTRAFRPRDREREFAEEDEREAYRDSGEFEERS
jgi:hypothetical protein